ncbi:hypothetical protein [uncultured Croceitalea sp.]|uniref:hypothetical protein n=1 Tax=uncultured Croceitalea sp. TaxID=1798908 RepID=UPI00374EDF74
MRLWRLPKKLKAYTVNVSTGIVEMAKTVYVYIDKEDVLDIQTKKRACLGRTQP